MSHKMFMRGTVMVVDLLLLFPVIWYAINVFYGNLSFKERLMLFVGMAAHPGLLLIDHGHFQYNNVSLGLALAAIALISDNHELIGSMAFVFSLCYKQMSLYYAPAFFFFLLAKSTNHAEGIFSIKSFISLAKLGITVIISFLICLAPFLLQKQPLEQLQQLTSRVFPVARGLYEDKVANLWCSISPVFKLQNMVSQPLVVQICLVSTLIGMGPAALALLRAFRPHPKNSVRASASPFAPAHTFLVGLCCTAFSFFFFSYHVHEKSVLLPAFMLSLWFFKSPTLVGVAALVSTISMLPLLQRDGHEYSLLVLVVIYFIYLKVSNENVNSIFVGVVSFIPLSFHLLSKVITPPSSLPDLFTLLLTSSSFGILALCWLSLYSQLFLLDHFAPCFLTSANTKHVKEE